MSEPKPTAAAKSELLLMGHFFRRLEEVDLPTRVRILRWLNALYATDLASDAGEAEKCRHPSLGGPTQ